MKTKSPEGTLLLTDGKATNYNDLLVIDETNLSAEFASHAAWLGYIGVLTAEAEAEYEKAKLEADQLEAETDAKARVSFNRSNVKATEAMVKAYVLMDDDYTSALDSKIEKLKTYKTLKALETAMKEKGNMLVSLGATMRQEMDMTNLVSRIRRE